MKDFLQDLVAHTHTLGILPIVKVTATPAKTRIDSLSEDKTVILNATTHTPVSGVDGVFGMQNLNKLDLHLKCPEYRDNALISLTTAQRGDNTVLTGVHFKNAAGDFENDYQFLSQQIVDMRLKTGEFDISKWGVEFEPQQASIQRLKYQAVVHTEHPLVSISLQNGELIFKFGDIDSTTGSFVFHAGITGTLKKTYAWPKSAIISVLNLDGRKLIRITDQGALQIVVDSGIAEYKYTFPAEL